MKIDLSNKAQRWRLVTFTLCLLNAMAMAIPGSYVSSTAEPDSVYFTSYALGDYYSMAPQLWTIYAFAVLACILSFRSAYKKKNRAVVICLCNAAVLLATWNGNSIPTALVYNVEHLWLAFAPVVLSALAIIASVISGLLSRNKKS